MFRKKYKVCRQHYRNIDLLCELDEWGVVGAKITNGLHVPHASLGKRRVRS